MKRDTKFFIAISIIILIMASITTSNPVNSHFRENVTVPDNVSYLLFKYHGIPNDPNVTKTGWHYEYTNSTYSVYSYQSHNLVVNSLGVTWVANKLFTSNYQNLTTIAQYVGITADSVAPAYTDVRLASESTASGLARAVCTTLTLNTASSGLITATCVITFTNTSGGAVNSLQKAGWFVNSATNCSVGSGSCLFAENTFAVTNLNNNDAIKLTWNANIQG